MDSQKTLTAARYDLNALIEDYMAIYGIDITAVDPQDFDDDETQWKVAIKREDDGSPLGTFDLTYSYDSFSLMYTTLKNAYVMIEDLQELLCDSDAGDLYGFYVVNFDITSAFIRSLDGGKHDDLSYGIKVKLCDTWKYCKQRVFKYSITEKDWIHHHDDNTITVLGEVLDERAATISLAKNLGGLYDKCGVHIKIYPEKGFKVTACAQGIPADYRNKYKSLTMANVRDLYKTVGYTVNAN